MLKISKAQVVETPDLHSLDAEIDLLHQLKQEALAASVRAEEQQAKVIDLLRLEGRKSAKGRAYRATLVQSTYTKYNEAGLKKALGATVWRKVTKAVLDTSKLDQAVADGEVDIHVVAANSQVLEKKPYVRVSPITDDDE